MIAEEVFRIFKWAAHVARRNGTWPLSRRAPLNPANTVSSIVENQFLVFHSSPRSHLSWGCLDSTESRAVRRASTEIPYAARNAPA